MIATAPRQTNRGTYRCPYCAHASWKQYGAAKRHIEEHHADEAKAAEQEQTIIKLQREKAELETKLAAAQKPPEKKPEKEYYQCVLYCTVENKVFKAGMPKGVLPENVTCSNCGVKGSLKITNNDPSWMI